ncbi:MAG: S1 RNA-binding domain-containing protein [Patescibacteria group bacterium]|nr:S1 RNA-binding domain-containing protein [Patescibacteria group bacterium]
MATQKNNQSSSNDFAELLKHDDIKIPQIGDTVTGIVLSASKSEVRLDINGVITGVVRGRELYYEAEEYANLKPGGKIEATVFEEENENGELELSFRHAGEQKAWDNLISAYENKKIIKVKVSNANKGGLLVSYGQIIGFLPVSQLSPDNYPRISGGDKSKILTKLKSFVNNEFEVKIIALDQKEERLVVSEKEAWQENKKDIINKYKVGSVVKGKITAITNFGVFINFAENLEGLIHISELAWQRIDNPASLFKRGDTLSAEIISIDGPKIFLSAKKLIKDPWQDAGKKYKEGQAVVCDILKVNPFGLFVKLDKDIHGLAHISQLNLAPDQKINQIFKVGDKQKFIIASVEPEEHRLGLAIGKRQAASGSKS